MNLFKKMSDGRGRDGAPMGGWMNGPFSGALCRGPAVLGRAPAILYLNLRIALIAILLTLWIPPHNAPSHLEPRGCTLHTNTALGVEGHHDLTWGGRFLNLGNLRSLSWVSG